MAVEGAEIIRGVMIILSIIQAEVGDGDEGQALPDLQRWIKQFLKQIIDSDPLLFNPVFRIRFRIGSGFRGVLDRIPNPDPDTGL